MSFYKMFGYPTGVGCLLVRDKAMARLRRPWFAGGTVNFATVQGRAHILAKLEAGFEDGTLNYLSIPAVAIGLRHLERRKRRVAARGGKAAAGREAAALGRVTQRRHQAGNLGQAADVRGRSDRNAHSRAAEALSRPDT